MIMKKKVGGGRIGSYCENARKNPSVAVVDVHMY